MFNVGGMELVVIGLVALIVLGPDKLPGALRQAGSVLGELRRISRGFQTDLKGALEEAERQAEREQRAAEAANRAGPPPAGEATHDPGAAMAAAQAELDAIEAAAAAGPVAGTAQPAPDGPQDAPGPRTAGDADAPGTDGPRA